MFKFFNILMLMVTLCTISDLSASSENWNNDDLSNTVNFLKINQFNSWVVFKGSEKKNELCHVVAKPYFTKGLPELEDNSQRNAYIVFSYLGHNKFTLSINVGYSINQDHQPYIIIDELQHLLRPSWRTKVAITYSSTQDVDIINYLVKSNSKILKVRSYDNSLDTALDYYYMEGLLDALKYVIETKKCQKQL